jgi:hypothetical protein
MMHQISICFAWGFVSSNTPGRLAACRLASNSITAALLAFAVPFAEKRYQHPQWLVFLFRHEKIYEDKSNFNPCSEEKESPILDICQHIGGGISDHELRQPLRARSEDLTDRSILVRENLGTKSMCISMNCDKSEANIKMKPKQDFIVKMKKKKKKTMKYFYLPEYPRYAIP